MNNQVRIVQVQCKKKEKFNDEKVKISKLCTLKYNLWNLTSVASTCCCCCRLLTLMSGPDPLYRSGRHCLAYIAYCEKKLTLWVIRCMLRLCERHPATWEGKLTVSVGADALCTMRKGLCMSPYRLLPHWLVGWLLLVYQTREMVIVYQVLVESSQKASR